MFEANTDDTIVAPAIVVTPDQITRLIIPAGCPIGSYESTLIALFEEDFPLLTSIENTSMKNRWALDDVKAHFERISRFASRLTAQHRVAIVAMDALGFGQGRMAQGNLSRTFPCAMEVFDDFTQARSWLLASS